MKSKLSILIFLLLTIQLYGQSDTSLYKNQIKFSPLRIVDLVNPGFELSFERLYLNKFSTQLSAAFMTKIPGLPPYRNFRGYRFSIEGKCFFEFDQRLKNFNRRSRQYYSAEVIYYKTNFSTIYKFENEFSQDSLKSDYRYNDTFSVNKKMLIFNLKWGVQYKFNHFVFDLGAGLGLKYKDVLHSDRLNPNDQLERSRHPNLVYMTLAEGKYYTVSIPFNIKIGYAF